MLFRISYVFQRIDGQVVQFFIGHFSLHKMLEYARPQSKFLIHATIDE